MDTVDYGSEIRHARYARHWSLEHLADESGMTVPEVEAVERGDSDNVCPLLRALELTPLLCDQRLADFMRVMRPTIDRIPEAQLPLALGEVLKVVGRAAAGDDPAPPAKQHVTVESGGSVEVAENHVT